MGDDQFKIEGVLAGSVSRRDFLMKSVVGGAGFLMAPGLFAELLEATPRQAEGPFFPNVLPLDTDNDLLILNDVITPAVGEVTHLHGKVTDVRGVPLRNALVEIWQVDSKGAYIHTGDPRHGGRDKNFQGYGRFLTGLKGEYYFRTIKPVAYPGRTPHIHVRVSHGGMPLLTTQLYIDGEAMNARDGLLRRAGDKKGALMVKFLPLKGSKVGELQAEFDIILGVTPEDADHGAGAKVDKRGELVAEARKMVGEFGDLKYKFGGATPEGGGFDCSGAMSFLLKRCGYSPPRTSAQQYVWVRDNTKIHKVGKKVESMDAAEFTHLRVGDLLFWSGTYEPTDGRRVNITHVGIYLGKEKDGRRIMACASKGRSYRGKKGDGYGIYDFKLPSKTSTSTFVGYGSIPGMS